jgi:hypothetical protein
MAGRPRSPEHASMTTKQLNRARVEEHRKKHADKKRIELFIPKSTVEQLDKLCSEQKISRSVAIERLINGNIPKKLTVTKRKTTKKKPCIVSYFDRGLPDIDEKTRCEADTMHVRQCKNKAKSMVVYGGVQYTACKRHCDEHFIPHIIWQTK